MQELSLREIINAIGGTALRESGRKVLRHISTDSRTVMAGELFFAFKGENFDAHLFLEDVISRGCDSLVVSDASSVPQGFSGNAILVSDTLIAYQDLAADYRQLIDPVVVAVTGSVGKTSLKDMVASVASEVYRTVASEKNFNNQIGVPLTIFQADSKTEVLILEMGMSSAGELHRLAEIAKPDIAAITGIGLSHRENFSTDDGIFKAKMEITDFFDESSILIVNGDDPKLRALADANGSPYRIETAGISAGNVFRVSPPKYTGISRITFNIDYGYETERFELPVAGLYNGITAGLASAVLAELDIGLSRTAEVLRDTVRTPHRLELILGEDIAVIDDTYNASPDSMKSGIEFLMSKAGTGTKDDAPHRRIAVLADMKELGPDSGALHRSVGKAAAVAGIDILVTVGDAALEIAEGAAEDAGKHSLDRGSIFSFNNNDEAILFLNERRARGDIYLVKGSHSMHTEEIVAALIRKRVQSC